MLYPLKFKPLFKERIWGGRALESVLGKQLPQGKLIGESWEISGVPGDVTVVAEGDLKGNDLQELIEIYMGDLIGDHIYQKFGVEFPLLIKYIDAREKLSIQVHPDDELAFDRHNSYGKTEMWYVIDAEPGAWLYLGFNRDVTPQEYDEALESGRIEDLLQRIEVKPGDAFFIPAGTLHAIGKGLLLAEIQETSDVTYRIYDWDRLDHKGRPRELHRELAFGAIDFGPVKALDITAAPETNRLVRLIENEYFTTNILKIDDYFERDYSTIDSFVIYMCLEGDLMVCYSGGSIPLVTGETVLVPRQEDYIEIDGEGTILEVYIK